MTSDDWKHSLSALRLNSARGPDSFHALVQEARVHAPADPDAWAEACCAKWAGASARAQVRTIHDLETVVWMHAGPMGVAAAALLKPLVHQNPCTFQRPVDTFRHIVHALLPPGSQGAIGSAVAYLVQHAVHGAWLRILLSCPQAMGVFPVKVAVGAGQALAAAQSHWPQAPTPTDLFNVADATCKVLHQAGWLEEVCALERVQDAVGRLCILCSDVDTSNPFAVYGACSFAKHVYGGAGSSSSSSTTIEPLPALTCSSHAAQWVHRAFGGVEGLVQAMDVVSPTGHQCQEVAQLLLTAALNNVPCHWSKTVLLRSLKPSRKRAWPLAWASASTVGYPENGSAKPPHGGKSAVQLAAQTVEATVHAGLTLTPRTPCPPGILSMLLWRFVKHTCPVRATPSDYAALAVCVRTAKGAGASWAPQELHWAAPTLLLLGDTDACTLDSCRGTLFGWPQTRPGWMALDASTVPLAHRVLVWYTLGAFQHCPLFANDAALAVAVVRAQLKGVPKKVMGMTPTDLLGFAAGSSCLPKVLSLWARAFPDFKPPKSLVQKAAHKPRLLPPTSPWHTQVWSVDIGEEGAVVHRTATCFGATAPWHAPAIDAAAMDAHLGSLATALPMFLCRGRIRQTFVDLVLHNTTGVRVYLLLDVHGTATASSVLRGVAFVVPDDGGDGDSDATLKLLCVAKHPPPASPWSTGPTLFQAITAGVRCLRLDAVKGAVGFYQRMGCSVFPTAPWAPVPSDPLLPMVWLSTRTDTSSSVSSLHSAPRSLKA